MRTNNVSIRRATIVFLQTAIILFAIVVLAFLLWEPHVEGVNAHATTLSEIYFDDPFLAYAYMASIPFFVILYQAFTLLRYMGRNELFSQRSVKAVRMIKQCAMAMIVLIVLGVVFLMLGESDDRPPIIMMGTVATLFFAMIAAGAARFEWKVQNAVDMKAENDLTV